MTPHTGPKLTRRFLRRKKQKSATASSDVSRHNSNPHSEEDRRLEGGSTPSPRRSRGQADDSKAKELRADNHSASSAGEEADAGLRDAGEKKRFWALVQKKKEEREAREDQDEAKALARHERLGGQADGSLVSEIDSDGDDSAIEKNLTQAPRAARKASKKAIEEMSRETQRMSRNMQLTHEATTVKKITKESLMGRFNFRGNVAKPAEAKAASSTVTSSMPCSDMEEPLAHTSPMTSPGLMDGFGDADPRLPKPATGMDRPKKGDATAIQSLRQENNLAVSDQEPRARKMDKGKGKAVEPPKQEAQTQKPVFTQRPIKLRPPKEPVRPDGFTLDMDSDLEIELPSKSKSRALEVLSRVPERKATQDRSRTAQRALAHLTSPGRRKAAKQGAMSQGDLQASLRAKARQQAARERAEKLQDLKARGIVVQTAGEREKEQAEVENLLEKARQEELELTKRERHAAKKEQRENGENDGLLSSDDEDYQEHDAEDDIDISGSEEADDEGDEEEDEEENDMDEAANDMKHQAGSPERAERTPGLSLIEDEASESDADETEEHDSANEVSDVEINDAPRNDTRRRPRRAVIDDEEDEEIAPVLANASDSATRPANPFGGSLGAGPVSAPMGLTQAFAATMSDSQVFDQQDSLADIPPMTMPDPPSPGFDTLVVDSQPLAGPSQTATGSSQVAEDYDTQITAFAFTQSQVVQDSLIDQDHVLAAQPSQMPDPTQDRGFEHMSPVRDRFAPPAPSSTVDTVLLSTNPRNPPAIKKGRLRRRGEVASFSDPEDGDVSASREKNQAITTSDAFGLLRKAAKKPAPETAEFDKKESKAKEMVEEQAEESEDEYAGLGGASDDNSEAEEDEEVLEMIDAGNVEVDERKLAAFHA